MYPDGADYISIDKDKRTIYVNTNNSNDVGEYFVSVIGIVYIDTP